MMLSILLLSVITLASAQNSLRDDDDGEYGHYNTWRKAMCEKGDPEMFREMEICIQLEDKAVVDATLECAKKFHPESEGDTVAYMNAACQDLSLFKKMDDCFEKCETDPDFVKKMELSDEAIKCYEGVAEEYNLESLRNYFKDSSTE